MVKRYKQEKAIFKDTSDCIPVTFFDNNVSKIRKAKGYQITNICVSLFQTQRILKTTETKKITGDDNCKYDLIEVES